MLLTQASLKLWSDSFGIAEITPESGLPCRKLTYVLQSKMGHILSSLSCYHLL